MNNTTLHGESSRIDIAARAAMSVDICAGATIRVVQGKVWLTQEGDWRDYCVCAGVTFCADRTGRAVIHAVDGPATVVLTRPDARVIAPLSRGRLHIDSIAQLTRAAKQAQAQFVARSFVALGTWIVTRFRRLLDGDASVAAAARCDRTRAARVRPLRSPGPFPLTGSGRTVYRVR